MIVSYQEESINQAEGGVVINMLFSGCLLSIIESSFQCSLAIQLCCFIAADDELMLLCIRYTFVFTKTYR